MKINIRELGGEFGGGGAFGVGSAIVEVQKIGELGESCPRGDRVGGGTRLRRLGTMAVNNIVDGFVPDKAPDGPSSHVVFGLSEVMRSIRLKVEKVAGTNVPVLIQGESGTGKEVLARMIHHLSPSTLGAVCESELRGDSRHAA